jgi:hypothetical protein
MFNTIVKILKSIVKFLINYKNYWVRYKVIDHRQRIFDQFNHTNIIASHFFMRLNIPVESEVDNHYDAFVAGSDQIWHPVWGEGLFDKYFLSFAAPGKRIAYAASFGVPHIPEERMKLFTEYLKGMDYISVREQSGARIVKQLIGKDVPVLVDPTLLLSRDEWQRIEHPPE